MTRKVAEILAERLSVVLAIAEANGARQRAQASASGATIERMDLEDHPGAAGDLAVAQARDAAAQARLAEAADRIAALDERLAALDRELAAAGG